MNSGLYEHIEAFVAIARSRSLTAASIATGIGQATISRQLAALEKHLGCRLFLRSTRAIKLTEQGEAYLSHALRLLEMVSEAERSVQANKEKMHGRIRIACSNAFAKNLLIPNLAGWQTQYPDIHIEFVLSDSLSHVIEERVDVAFRIGTLSDSSLVARPIGKFNRIVVAAPGYLNQYGVPTRPEQLSDHQCILFSGTEHSNIWNFGGPNGEIKVRVTSRLELSTLDGVYNSVIAGLGIAIVPEWFLASEFTDGQVRRLFNEYSLSDRIVNAVMHERYSSDGKVALFIRFVEKILIDGNYPTS